MMLSALIAVRNEAAILPKLLRDLDSQQSADYAVEVLFADGDSTDDTPRIIDEWRGKTRYRTRLYRNPARLQYAGVNLLVRAAKGELLLKLDGHSRIADDFLRANVAAHATAGADIVGGWMSCVGAADPMASAIRAAQRARFGAGGAAFRVGGRAHCVDAVPFPCVHRRVFEHIGLFRGSLVRNADTEFFSRARRGGHRIWYDPRIRSSYYVRATLASVAVQQFRNGYWFPAMLGAARLRHVVPLLFVLAWAGIPILGAVWTPIWYIVFATMVACYSLIVTATTLLAKEGHLSLYSRLLMLLVIPAMHFGYGCGWLVGFCSPQIWAAIRRGRRPPPQLSSEAEA